MLLPRMKILANLAFFSMLSVAHAGETIINNYTTQPQPMQQPSQPENASSSSSNCNNNQNNNSQPGLQPGTYRQANPDGSYNTVYTTGDKKPFYVDNPCTQQPVIQPYIGINPPGTTGTTTSPTTGTAAAPITR